MNEVFHRFAQKVSILAGSAQAFVFACLLIIAWAISGPWFHFSDTWELIINTLTTIITFLMVFVIQNSQNRDIRSLHLKMDELIRASKLARNNLINLENMTDTELTNLENEFSHLVHNEKEKRKHLS